MKAGQYAEPSGVYTIVWHFQADMTDTVLNKSTNFDKNLAF